MPFGFDRGDAGGAELPATVRTLEPSRDAVVTVWTRWRTAVDERVCPACGPLDGRVWPEHEGPMPPLHEHCRCAREFAFEALTTAR